MRCMVFEFAYNNADQGVVIGIERLDKQDISTVRSNLDCWNLPAGVPSLEALLHIDIP